MWDATRLHYQLVHELGHYTRRYKQSGHQDLSFLESIPSTFEPPPRASPYI